MTSQKGVVTEPRDLGPAHREEGLGFRGGKGGDGATTRLAEAGSPGAKKGVGASRPSSPTHSGAAGICAQAFLPTHWGAAGTDGVRQAPVAGGPDPRTREREVQGAWVDAGGREVEKPLQSQAPTSEPGT